MIVFLTLVAIVQSFAVSLGVGSSTLAIINFFVAIADGKIDETERRMMGVVYVVLRIAMVVLLFTTIFLATAEYTSGLYAPLSASTIAQIAILIALFLNAGLMTARIIPSTFGPAIQAGSWYALGSLFALQIVGVTSFTVWQFLLGYVTLLILAVSIVNGIMAVLKAKKANRV